MNTKEISRAKAALRRAAESKGSQQALAAAIGVTQSAVAQWIASGSVTAERSIEIERATGGLVSRCELRPDLFGPPPDRAGEAA